MLASRTQHELERGVGAAYAEIVRELDAVRAEKSGGVVEVGYVVNVDGVLRSIAMR